MTNINPHVELPATGFTYSARGVGVSLRRVASICGRELGASVRGAKNRKLERAGEKKWGRDWSVRPTLTALPSPDILPTPEPTKP